MNISSTLFVDIPLESKGKITKQKGIINNNKTFNLKNS
jgi:hypothetical protein